MAKLAFPAGKELLPSGNAFTIFSRYFHRFFHNVFKWQCWLFRLRRSCGTLAMPSQYFHNIFTIYSQYFHEFFTIFHNIFKWQGWPFQLGRNCCTLAMPSQYCSFALNTNLHCTICTIKDLHHCITPG